MRCSLVKHSLRAVVTHCFPSSSCLGAEFGFAVISSQSSYWNAMGTYSLPFSG